MVPVLLLAPVAGRMYDRMGPRGLVAAGAALLSAGLIWTAMLLGQLDYAWLVPGIFIAGSGIALPKPASTDAMNTAPPALRGQAQGVSMTLRQAGGAVGVAIMGTVMASIQSRRLTDFANAVGANASVRAHVKAVLAAAHGDPAGLRILPEPVLHALRDSTIAAISGAVYIGGAVVFAGALVAWLFLRRVPAADALPGPYAEGTVHPADLLETAR
jgi:hypothetical protein